MAVLPCDSCGSRFLGKAVVLYTAFMAGGDRVAFKQRFCFGCGQENLGRIVKIAAPETEGQAQLPSICPACGSAMADDETQIIYGTAYYSGERKDLVVVVCESCNDKIRPEIESKAERLQDRNPGGRNGGAPMPAPSAAREKALPW